MGGMDTALHPYPGKTTRGHCAAARMTLGKCKNMKMKYITGQHPKLRLSNLKWSHILSQRDTLSPLPSLRLLNMLMTGVITTTKVSSFPQCLFQEPQITKHFVTMRTDRQVQGKYIRRFTATAVSELFLFFKILCRKC